MNAFFALDKSAASRIGDDLIAILLFSLGGLILSLALPAGPGLLAVLGAY
jgi:hypothetical protein